MIMSDNLVVPGCEINR